MQKPKKGSKIGQDLVSFMALILWWLGCSATFTWLLLELSA